MLGLHSKDHYKYYHLRPIDRQRGGETTSQEAALYPPRIQTHGEKGAL